MYYHFINVIVDENNNFVRASVRYIDNNLINAMTIDDPNQIYWHLNSFARQLNISYQVLISDPSKVKLTRCHLEKKPLEFTYNGHNDKDQYGQSIKSINRRNNRVKGVKKIASISLALIIALGASGYVVSKNNAVYNNKNIRIINMNVSRIPKNTDYLLHNYKEFDQILKNCINDNYDSVDINDINKLSDYLDIMSACNFAELNSDTFKNHSYMGYLINMEDYFEDGSMEKSVITVFESMYDDIVKILSGEKRGRIDEVMNDYCERVCHYLIDVSPCTYVTRNGDMGYFNINNVSFVANLMIFKMAREVAEISGYKHKGRNGYTYSNSDVLRRMDDRINFSLDLMRSMCNEGKKSK